MADKGRTESGSEKGHDNVGFEIELEEKRENIVELKSRSSTLSTRDDEQQKIEGLLNIIRYDKPRRNYWIKTTFLVTIALLYNAYFAATVWYAVYNDRPIDFCDGVGFHILLTGFVYLGLFYFQIVKRYWGKAIYRSVMKPIGKRYDRVWKYRSVSSLNS